MGFELIVGKWTMGSAQQLGKFRFFLFERTLDNCPLKAAHYNLYCRIGKTYQNHGELIYREASGLFHKTFSFTIYCHFAVNYGIFAFMSKFTVKIWP